jgi:purine-nucleoside phosphorylase
MDDYDRVREAADAIAARVPEIPLIAVVLGSGLGDFAGSVAAGVSIPYDELPHWPASRVIGHESRLVVGSGTGRRAGRTGPRLPGRDFRTVTFAVRVLGLLGVRRCC